MSQAEDLLNSLAEDEVVVTSAEPETEPHIIINRDKTVTIPEQLKRILVQYEHNIETVTFDCPRSWDGHDLSTMGMKVVFQRSDGHKESHPVENLRVDESDDSMIHFDWTISRNTTLAGGEVRITVCAKIADAEGIVDREWHTIPNQDLYVNEGIDCSDDEIVEEYPDIIESILVRLDLAEQGGASDEQIAAAVEAYMTEHPVEVPDSGQNPYELPIATAETLGGVMPVAKTEDMTQPVGVDENGQLYTKPGGGGSDYTLPVGGNELGGVKNGGNVTINADGTMTAPEAEVSDEQVQTAVSGWLEENPDKVTTVQDGSIGKEKLTETLQDELGIRADGVVMKQIEDFSSMFHGIRISDANVAIAASSYRGYLIDTSTLTHEIIVCSGAGASKAIYIEETAIAVGDTITPTGVSLVEQKKNSGGSYYYIAPGNGTAMLNFSSEPAALFVGDSIIPSKRIDVPGAEYIEATLYFSTYTNESGASYYGVEIPKIPDGSVCFARFEVSNGVGNLQVLDVTSAVIGLETAYTQSWISDGQPHLLRFLKYLNKDVVEFFTSMRITLCYIPPENIKEFRKANKYANAELEGIYANDLAATTWLALFADHLECDIRQSSDGALVLNHNAAFEGLTIAETALADLVAAGIWTYDDLLKYAVKTDCGISADYKQAGDMLPIRMAHAATGKTVYYAAKGVAVSGVNLENTPWLIHATAGTYTGEEYMGQWLCDAGGTIDAPVLSNALNIRGATGYSEIRELAQYANGIDVYQVDVSKVKATLTAMYGCTY